MKLLGVVRQDVLSGIRDARQYETILRALRAFPNVPLEIEDYELAAHYSNVALAAGITASAIDFLICAVAVRRNWLIYSPDRDFRHIARQLPIGFHSPEIRRRR